MKHIFNIYDMLKISEELYEYLEGKIEFDVQGRPIFKKEFFLEEWPEQMVTWENRNSKYIKDKSKTLMCFYMKDKLIYPRVANILDEVEKYKGYLGVVQPDITLTRDMDIELQNAIMIVNQLVIAVLAVNGVKIVINTRAGIRETENNFKNIPENIMCSSGFLGCNKATNYQETSLYINKILSLRPKRIVIYGKKDNNIQDQMDILGINYRRYDDFHTYSKRGCV